MSDRNFDGIEELCADIEQNYNDSEVGKYRVVSVGDGTVESIVERLTARKKTKLIYLILEETDG